jgi:hypothetical protein
MEDLLVGGNQADAGGRWFPGAGVAVRARDGGAGHLHPDAVAAVEAVAGRPQVHIHAPYTLGVGGDLPGRATDELAATRQGGVGWAGLGLKASRLTARA